MTGNVLFTALDKLKPKDEASLDMLPPSRMAVSDSRQLAGGPESDTYIFCWKV